MPPLASKAEVWKKKRVAFDEALASVDAAVKLGALVVEKAFVL